MAGARIESHLFLLRQRKGVSYSFPEYPFLGSPMMHEAILVSAMEFGMKKQNRRELP